MYQNKVMLITGAYRGIGKEIVNYFSNLGMNIIMTYHEKKNETILLANKLMEKYHNSIKCYYVDLSNEGSIKSLLESILNDYQKIDYLVNNAAISKDNDILNKTKDEFMHVLEVNSVGTFLMMKYFDYIISNMIINISSTDGIDTGNIYSVDYNASKAAINSITKTFSLYSKNKVISICPNWVDVESTKDMDKDYLDSELKRIGQKRLISPSVIPKVIDDLIKTDIPSGSIIRIEGDDDVRRID